LEGEVILALDTSTDTTGLALFDGERVLAEQLWFSREHATVDLAPEIALLLRRTRTRMQDLTALAVALGPGSFTGLRIGLALARGLALAGRRKLVGVPTLDILARAQPGRAEPMLAFLHAGRNRLAGVWYKWGKRGWKAQGDPEGFTWDELRARWSLPAYLCGDFSAGERDAWKDVPGATLSEPALSVRRPGILAAIGWGMQQARKPADALRLTPLYLSRLDQVVSSPRGAGAAEQDRDPLAGPNGPSEIAGANGPSEIAGANGPSEIAGANGGSG
jgi:tRNA threonylcarbamoyladenosine biosynthesis protein TsaB